MFSIFMAIDFIDSMTCCMSSCKNVDYFRDRKSRVDVCLPGFILELLGTGLEDNVT